MFGVYQEVRTYRMISRERRSFHKLQQKNKGNKNIYETPHQFIRFVFLNY